jgi:hypothetical protein
VHVIKLFSSTRESNDDRQTLISFNLELIQFFWQALSLKTELLLQSELGITGTASDLLINICRHVQAESFLTFPVVEKYLDSTAMQQNGIRVIFANFHPPIYRQLWGDFIYNLSIWDLLCNCGPKSREIISEA